MMQPLKITAVMQDGRLGGAEPWFPLDSILAAEWMRRNHPDKFYNASSNMLSGQWIVAELPFERRGSGDDWYWACSFNTEKPIHEYITYWHKRFDDHLERYVDFGKRRGKIDIKSGKFKAHRMPLVTQIFDKLIWYAVGDLDAVLDLCMGVTHIGKKVSQGLGCVDYWRVEPHDHDWSEIMDGKVTRSLPVSLGMPKKVREAAVAEKSVRPPYWLVDNQKLCYVPRW